MSFSLLLSFGPGKSKEMDEWHSHEIDLILPAEQNPAKILPYGSCIREISFSEYH